MEGDVDFVRHPPVLWRTRSTPVAELRPLVTEFGQLK
jgi:hypothetical protein